MIMFFALNDHLRTFAPERIARGMPSSGSSNFDFDLLHFGGFTNEFRIFSAFLHSSKPDGSLISLNRQPCEVGHLLYSEEGNGLFNFFCMV